MTKNDIRRIACDFIGNISYTDGSPDVSNFGIAHNYDIGQDDTLVLILEGEDFVTAGLYNGQTDTLKDMAASDRITPDAVTDIILELIRNNYDIIAEESPICRCAYKFYQNDWINHNVTESMKENLFKGYMYSDLPFTDYLSEWGFDGSMYVCFDEFMHSEFTDADYMKSLFRDENLFKQYEEYCGKEKS